MAWGNLLVWGKFSAFFGAKERLRFLFRLFFLNTAAAVFFEEDMLLQRFRDSAQEVAAIPAMFGPPNGKRQTRKTDDITAPHGHIAHIVPTT